VSKKSGPNLGKAIPRQTKPTLGDAPLPKKEPVSIPGPGTHAPPKIVIPSSGSRPGTAKNSKGVWE
jgi:hypothetical protein